MRHECLHVGTHVGLNATQKKLDPVLLTGPNCGAPSVSGGPVWGQQQRSELRLMSPSASSQTSSWSGAALTNQRRRNSAHFVPDCDFKECQKLVNILELGVCQRQARSVRHLFRLLSEGNRCSHMKENFISKIAFSILALLEAFSDRNSHVIIHCSYWKLLKLIHWDIWRLREGRSLPDLNRIICKKQISVATAWIDLFLGFIIQFTMRVAHVFMVLLCLKTSWSLFLQSNILIMWKKKENIFITGIWVWTSRMDPDSLWVLLSLFLFLLFKFFQSNHQNAAYYIMRAVEINFLLIKVKMK